LVSDSDGPHFRCGSDTHSTVSRYVKVAALLPNKTVRDVAARVRWMEAGMVRRLCHSFDCLRACALPHLLPLLVAVAARAP
jgi:hypothetical protein